MSSGNSDDASEPVKRRKGVMNADKYKSNIIRKSRVQGIQYESYSGKEVQGKEQQTYQCRCVEKCYSNTSEESGKTLWNYFYSLESKNTQDVYLQSLIELRGFKRKRKQVVTPSDVDEGEGTNEIYIIIYNMFLGFQTLFKVLYDNGVKSLLPRHVNQDPLECFFGATRSVSSSNSSCSAFASAYKTLLLNNFMSSHSPSSNCEDIVEASLTSY